ncbi:hypothetical protein Spith_0409 [Spirochaeta thermophila DSM 6578]|uniref:Lipoprotein n=1 Tax=Winmispira thermophila (strain ATCC 700085 / DSM 6578 / Z-1203) TaxID=869211 RepID=G0GEK5_WINT7|nr:hypothetical protein [Spirochaeta thermophila]AEJ60693.1 hypothetical protein Spith_0409 [Spirochaeta thermophila DSM 6578]
MRPLVLVLLVFLAGGCVSSSKGGSVHTSQPAEGSASTLPASGESPAEEGSSPALSLRESRLSPEGVEPPALTPAEQEEIWQAHLAALDQEIDRLETLLERDRKDAESLEAFIARLSEEKAELQREGPAAYRPSLWLELEGSMVGPPEFGQLFYYKGMTRSGPFYHLAGLKGGALSAFREERPYRILAAVLCRRYYPFPSSYIFVYRWDPLR